MPDIFSIKPKEKSHETQPKPHAINPALASVDKLVHAPHHPMKLFATYAMTPKGVTFANQEPDEIILLFLRRHFITNIPWIITTALFAIIPIVFLLIVNLVLSFALPFGLTFVLVAFYYLIIVSYGFSKFISWFYNIGVITQKRIVDLDSMNILSHNTAAANFNEIVDIKFTQRGFFQSTFDFGDIHIQTEAINANFEFDACPKPTEVSDIISDLRVVQKGGHHGDS